MSTAMITGRLKDRVIIFCGYKGLMNLARSGFVEYSIESNPSVDWECMTCISHAVCFIFPGIDAHHSIIAQKTAASSVSKNPPRAVRDLQISPECKQVINASAVKVYKSEPSIM